MIAAGALLMSLSLFVLAITGAMDRVYAVVPIPVIRGIQLELGYVLVRGAFKMLEKPLSPNVPQTSRSPGDMAVPMMLALAPLFLVIVALLVKKPVVPASLAVLAAGAGAGL